MRRVRKEKGRRKKIRSKKKSEESRCRCAKNRSVTKKREPLCLCNVSWRVRSLKRRARSHLGRWEIKNCTQLYKKHLTSGAILALGMSKKCTPLWHEAHLEKHGDGACKRPCFYAHCICTDEINCFKNPRFLHILIEVHHESRE